MLTDCLPFAGGKIAEHITRFVLYAGYKNGIHIDTPAGVSIVGSHHFVKGKVCRTQTQRNHRIEETFDPKPAAHLHQSNRAKLLHQVCRYVVAAAGKPPFEGNPLPYPFGFVGTFGCPCGVIHNKGLRYIHNLVARGHPLLHGQGVEEWLHCRANLPFGLACVVIFEVAVVRTTHVGPHKTGLGLHCHDRGPQE
ncbi:hypothetical protein SDC9_97975 [bioreactor metagenome]|uniref:Uncharacterized protein n=1 Tax=bioreactor metagenome TaxID=1076179 RepID=A0A645ADW7_9ZZZZ